MVATWYDVKLEDLQMIIFNRRIKATEAECGPSHKNTGSTGYVLHSMPGCSGLFLNKLNL